MIEFVGCFVCGLGGVYVGIDGLLGVGDTVGLLVGDGVGGEILGRLGGGESGFNSLITSTADW